VTATPRKEQFSGCLIGQCLGDALGFPVEGYPPEVCRQYVDGALGEGLTEKHGRGPFSFGQYTDDSQLARELLQSYAETGRFEPGKYANRISAIFSEGRIVGRGRATDQAAIRLSQGVSWEKAGTPPPSAGNGSAMRAGPVGLLFFDDPEKLIQAAYDQGRITHQDSRCSAGAVAIAGAVSLSLHNEKVQTKDFIYRLSEWVQGIEQSVADCIKQLTEWLPLPPDKAVTYIAKAGLESEYSEVWQGYVPHGSYQGISPFVTGSVLWSLYSFLKTPGDYRETICTAIRVGGDVDTTAAMAGAISGAYNGLNEIPSNLSRLLTDQGTWGFDELVDLADKCYDLKIQQLQKE